MKYTNNIASSLDSLSARINGLDPGNGALASDTSRAEEDLDWEDLIFRLFVVFA